MLADNFAIISSQLHCLNLGGSSLHTCLVILKLYWYKGEKCCKTWIIPIANNHFIENHNLSIGHRN